MNPIGLFFFAIDFAMVGWKRITPLKVTQKFCYKFKMDLFLSNIFLLNMYSLSNAKTQ